MNVSSVHAAYYFTCMFALYMCAT